MKILCIGNAAYDFTYPVDNFLIENTKSRVETLVECGGGTASNIAYLLGKWGSEVYFAGIVGNDIYGKKIKDELENANVNTKYLQFSDQYKTTKSIIVLNKSNGSRTVLSHRPDDMQMNDFELDFLPDIILLDGQEYEQTKKIINKYPKAVSIMDASVVNEQTKELASMVDYLICSKSFAEQIAKINIDYNNIKTINSLYSKLKQQFNNNIIVTLENMGALYEIKGKINIMKPLTVKVVDTTGAGDMFHGAFIYSIMKKMDLEHMIKLSNIAGSLAITKIGGRLSTPQLKDVEMIFDEYK